MRSRGHDYEGEVSVHLAGSSTRKLSRTKKKRRKRRSAVEVEIGHLKSDNRMRRCFLKGLVGDAVEDKPVNPLFQGRRITEKTLHKLLSDYSRCDGSHHDS